jgi:hypothetical protein
LRGHGRGRQNQYRHQRSGRIVPPGHSRRLELVALCGNALEVWLVQPSRRRRVPLRDSEPD